jgi:hypothetical protein
MELQVNAEAAGVPDNAAFKITGNVETSTYTGVRISDLLSKAGPQDDATTVVFVVDDGYSAETTLAEIEACADCIVSFRNQGGLSIVAPDLPGNVQVKGVVEIQVK